MNGVPQTRSLASAAVVPHGRSLAPRQPLCTSDPVGIRAQQTVGYAMAEQLSEWALALVEWPWEMVVPCLDRSSGTPLVACWTVVLGTTRGPALRRRLVALYEGPPVVGDRNCVVEVGSRNWQGHFWEIRPCSRHLGRMDPSRSGSSVA